MAKRKTQIDKAIADLDDKIAANAIEREQANRRFVDRQNWLDEFRTILLATKAAHATVKTSKAANVKTHDSRQG